MNEQNYKEVSTIGRWGRMHGRYLKDNHPVRYTVLLLLSGVVWQVEWLFGRT